jgi:hypothetical protein
MRPQGEDITMSDEFKRGVRTAFDYVLTACANNYHANPEQQKVRDTMNEFAEDVAEGFLRELSPDDHSNWKALEEQFKIAHDLRTENARLRSELSAAHLGMAGVREALEWYASDGDGERFQIIDSKGEVIANFSEFTSRAKKALESIPVAPLSMWQEVSAKAREWAAHYAPGTDGRNTFILFAEWAEQRALSTLTEEKVRRLVEKVRIVNEEYGAGLGHEGIELAAALSEVEALIGKQEEK